MKGIKALLKKIPGLHGLVRFIRSARRNQGISSDYTLLHGQAISQQAARLRDAWQNKDIPKRQHKLVQTQLAQFRQGQPVAVFDVMIAGLRALPVALNGLSLLEIGCSSGYYAEVIDIAGLGLHYAGCDYSPAFIDLARQCYPQLDFTEADATALPYDDKSFDIVISGCCLLHIPEYERAIAETARVTRQFAIFHRTPVVFGQDTKFYRKRAYGVESVEIHLNEDELQALFMRYNLEPITVLTLEKTLEHGGKGTATQTYVCRKRVPQ